MNTLPSLNLIIHKLCKDPHGPASLELRTEEMAITPLAEQLVTHLNDLYAAKPGKGYGKFETEAKQFPAEQLLRQYALEQTIDFGEFSRQMMQHLQEQVQEETLACGGYVLFARTRQSAAADALLVAIITEAVGTTMTHGLEMEESLYLDMANLRAAGRIDLAAWQSDSGRYISFLKGRTDVANYFKRFLGCNDVVAALKETQKLIKGIEQFAEAQQLPPDERNQLFEEAHRYLDDLGENDLPWSVDSVANVLCPDAPESLRTTLNDEQLGLTGGCIPDRRAIRPLLRFKGAASNWKLEFNRNSLRNGDVIYNRNNDTIVLYNIPEDLKRQLQVESGTEE